MIPVAYERTAALRRASAGADGVDPRLKPAAQEFEASLMQELLKPMEKDPLFSGSSDGGGSMFGGAGGNTWSNLGTQSLAKAMAQAGGFGIASKIMSQVAAEANQAQNAKPAGEAGQTDAGGSTSGSGTRALDEREGRADLKGWSSPRRVL